MAFPLGTRSDLPERTTFAGFHLNRLGQHQVVIAEYQETRDDWLVGPVVATLPDTEPDVTLRDTVQVATCQYVPSLVGADVTRTDTSVVVGTVSAHDTTLGTLTFAAAPGVDLTGVELKVQARNDFGVPVQRVAQDGRAWTLTLYSGEPTQYARLVQMQMEIFIDAVTAGLTALGVSKTAAEIQTAVVGLLQSGVNVESMIATAFERLEQDRQAGNISVPTDGTPPV